MQTKIDRLTNKILAFEEEVNFYPYGDKYIRPTLTNFRAEIIDKLYKLFIDWDLEPLDWYEFSNAIKDFIRHENCNMLKGLDVNTYTKKIKQLKDNAKAMAEFITDDVRLDFPKHPSAIYFIYKINTNHANQEYYLKFFDEVFNAKTIRGNMFTKFDEIFNSEDAWTYSENDKEYNEADLIYIIKAIHPKEVLIYSEEDEFIYREPF